MSSSIEQLIEEADLSASSSGGIEKHQPMYEKLKAEYEANASNAEFLWRYARVQYHYAQCLSGKDDKLREKTLMDAKQHALDAVERHPCAATHKWCAIILGIWSDMVSTKEKVALGHQIKHHMDEALKESSSDRTLQHLRGRWCFNVAELSWVERKLASALYGEIPKSSYEEALESFLQAEKDNNNEPWVENMYWVAKCYIAMKKTNEAVPYLEKAVNTEASDPDDLAAQRESKKLLAKHTK